MVASFCAMLFAAWQTTPKNLFELSPWMPSTPPLSGGAENPLHGPQPCEHPGLFLRISNHSWRNSSATGTTRCWTIKSHATLLPSSRFSSSMPLSLINFAITSRPSVIGLCQTQRFVAASPGHPTNPRPWALQPIIGSYRALSSILRFHQNLFWSQKVLFPTKSSRPRRNILTRWNWASRPGQSKMVYLPCQRLASLTCAIISGPNTPRTSPITLRSPSSLNFSLHSKVPSSIARTNTHHLCVSTVHACTITPSNKPSKILRSLNSYLMTHPSSSTPWPNLSNANTAKHTLGQWALVANFQQAASWPNERKTFAAADPSSLLLSPLFDLCSTFLPVWSFNWFQSLVPTTLPLEMYIHYPPFWNRRLSTQIWSWSIKTLRASSPALIKTDLSDPGSCSWTSCVYTWTSQMMKPSQSIWESQTIQVTSSKDVPFVVSMSHGKSSSKMVQTWSNQHWTCRHSPWARNASANAEAVQWEVLFPQPYVWWWFPSANKSGPPPFINSFPTTTCLSDTSVTSTTVSSSETNASLTLLHTKFFLTMDSMENPSSLKPNQIKNFLASCLKPNHLSWSIRDRPMLPKSCCHSLLHLLKFFSVVFAHAVALSSRALSRQFESNKVLPNQFSCTHVLAFPMRNSGQVWKPFWFSIRTFSRHVKHAPPLPLCCCSVSSFLFPFPFPPSGFAVVSLQLLGSTFASLHFWSPLRSWWTMFKVVPFITTWLGPLCISIIWRGSCPFSNHPLNGKTRCHPPISALKVRRQEASTPSPLCHRHLLHRRWWHMQASHHSWFWILNRTCVLFQYLQHTIEKRTQLQAHLRPLIAHPSQRIQSWIPIRAPQRWQTLLAQIATPEPRFRFPFDPNNVCLQLKIHNRRNAKKVRWSQTPVHQQRNDVAVVALFLSSRRSHLGASILMTPMVMQHLELPPPMITGIMTLTMAFHQDPPPHPPHLLALLLSHLHQIHMHHHLTPSAFSSQIHLMLLVILHSVHGPTLMIKS